MSTNRTRVLALGLAFAGLAGLVAACSSDGGNAEPNKPPTVTTGGGGSGGSAGDSDAGETNNGGSVNGGSTNNAGADNGGSAGEAGSAGAGAGPGPNVPECTLEGDEAFLNQPASGFHETFNNTARLGQHNTLPNLP